MIPFPLDFHWCMCRLLPLPGNLNERLCCLSRKKKHCLSAVVVMCFSTPRKYHGHGGHSYPPFLFPHVPQEIENIELFLWWYCPLTEELHFRFILKVKLGKNPKFLMKKTTHSLDASCTAIISLKMYVSLFFMSLTITFCLHVQNGKH